MATGAEAAVESDGVVVPPHACTDPQAGDHEPAEHGGVGGGASPRGGRQAPGGRSALGHLGIALAIRRVPLRPGGPPRRWGARRPGSNGRVVLGTATDQAEASGPVGGRHMARVGGPLHGPCRRDARGLVPFETREVVRQPGMRRTPRDAHGLTPGEGGIERVATCAHASPPGHGSASAPQASCSTLAERRGVSRWWCRRSAPLSASAAPVWSRGVASAWRSRGAPLGAGVRRARSRPRRTLGPMAMAFAKPPCGACMRRQTRRVVQRGRPWQREAPNASPTSWGRGRRSRRPPVPRTSSAPAAPSRASTSMAPTAPGRRPRRARRRTRASSRWPGGVRWAQRGNRQSTSSLVIHLGRGDQRQFGTVGTGLARSVALAPRWSSKRKQLRRAVASHCACPGLSRRACGPMQLVTSWGQSPASLRGCGPNRAPRKRRPVARSYCTGVGVRPRGWSKEGAKSPAMQARGLRSAALTGTGILPESRRSPSNRLKTARALRGGRYRPERSWRKSSRRCAWRSAAGRACRGSPLLRSARRRLVYCAVQRASPWATNDGTQGSRSAPTGPVDNRCKTGGWGQNGWRRCCLLWNGAVDQTEKPRQIRRRHPASTRKTTH